VAREGHAARIADSLGDGLRLVQTAAFDVVFLDVYLPDGSSLSILPQLQESPGRPEVIIITGEGSAEGAELAIKNGAWDYLSKPLERAEFLLGLERALQYRAEKRAHSAARSLKRENIIGNSPVLQACLDQLAQAALGDANVIITGETGTGKELFARSLHLNSARADRPFVIVDCAALPETLAESILFGYRKGAFTGAQSDREGLLREADGGTLFLDEIGELPPGVQKSFLRALQERRFRPVGSDHEVGSDFRLVAATHRDLDSMAEQGLFRSDLLYRLRASHIEIPPLRQRPADIRDIVLHHLDRLAARDGGRTLGFSPDFIECLLAFDWPGNVRELVHALEHAWSAAGSSPTLFAVHLPTRIRVGVARRAFEEGERSAGTESVEAVAGAEGERNASLVDAEAADGYALLERMRLPEDPGQFPSYHEFRDGSVAKVEALYFRELLRVTHRDIPAACRIAGLSRTRLYELMKTHGLTRS
jgi:two-component system NtrC family response regulator